MLIDTTKDIKHQLNNDREVAVTIKVSRVYRKFIKKGIEKALKDAGAVKRVLFRGNR